MKNKTKKLASVDANGAYSGSLLVTRKLASAEVAQILVRVPMTISDQFSMPRDKLTMYRAGLGPIYLCIS